MIDSAYVNVRDKGAVGDGTTDDTTAIQAALTTGLDVYVPGVSTYYKITAALTMLSGQRIFGDGDRSEIRQVTENANCITVTSRSDVSVERLHLYCPGSSTSLTNGCAVLFTECSRVRAIGNIVENHRGWGISANETNGYEFIGNWFINAAVSGITDDTDIAGDIQGVYGSGLGVIAYNHCLSGSGVGVKVQTVTDPDQGDDIVITGNIVKNSLAYGIFAYRKSEATPIGQSLKRVIITNNVINGVSGGVLSSATGTYTFGAGIYSQGCEDIIIANNQVSNTHSAAVAFASTLTPGGIGVTNQSRFTVANNNISDAGVNGIDISEGNLLGDDVHGGIVDGNVITNVTTRGIRLRSVRSASITNNRINTTGGRGIDINLVAPAVTMENSRVSGNVVENVTGVGIAIGYADGLEVSDNTVAEVTESGLTFANVNSLKCSGNLVKNQDTRGIQVASTCTLASVIGNVIDGTGTSTEGIRLDANTMQADNYISGCTAAWAGSFAPWQTLTVDSATPAVGRNRFYITANTGATTISNFTGGHDGQEIRVVFTDANTTLDFTSSSLKGNGGSDRAMAAGDAITAVYRASTGLWYVTVIDV